MTKQEFADIRKKAGLTQEKFGEAIGLTRVSIASIENGYNPITKQTELLVKMIFFPLSKNKSKKVGVTP